MQPLARFPVGPLTAALVLALYPAATASAGDYHVAPTGSPAGDGSVTDPWDLQTALDGEPGHAGPGDTVWLAPGEYLGHTEVRTTGTADEPLHIRGAGADQTALVVDYHHNPLEFDFYPEHVAHHIWVRDLEVRSLVGNRFDPEPGAPYDVEIGGGLATSYGEGMHFINLVVHDTGQGFSLYNNVHDAVVYGCLIYNNGFESTDRGHGHGIYAHHNDADRVVEIADNIILPQVGMLMQAYSTNGSILGFDMHGNMIIDGSMILGGTSTAPVDNFEFSGNYGYELRVALGYQGGFDQNISMVADDNYIHGHFQIQGYWQSLSVQGNTFVEGSWPFDIGVIDPDADGGSIAGWTIADQTHYANNETRWLDHDGYWYTLGEMQSLFGLESGSVLEPGPPPNKVVVQPNRYDEERAHLFIYNYEELDTVTVDLTDLGWGAGDTVRVRNARAYYEDLSDHSIGPDGVDVAMTNRMDQPLPDELPDPTGYFGVGFFPGFGIFVLERIATASNHPDVEPDLGWIEALGDDDMADDDDDEGDDDGGGDPWDEGGSAATTGCACRVAGPTGLWPTALSCLVVLSILASLRRRR